MVILATGHQFRCIRWVQVAIFNKTIGFYVDYNSLHVANMLKKDNCQRCTNKWLCASKHTCLFIYYGFIMGLEQGWTQSLVVSCTFWIVPVISIRDSGYSQVILFRDVAILNFEMLPFWRSISSWSLGYETIACAVCLSIFLIKVKYVIKVK